LKDVLPHRWIGQGDYEDLIFCPWLHGPPPNPFNYFLWGYVKDKVFVPPLPASIPDLQSRNDATVETITPDMLIKVWQESDYSLDVCHVAKGAHIEHLYDICYKLVELLSFLLVFVILYNILTNLINFQTASIIFVHGVYEYYF
jgi:hypothetical protein